jgi:hypothetical protein
MGDAPGDLTLYYLAPFLRAAKGVLSDDDFEAITARATPVIPGSGGFRTKWYAPIGSGKDKSSGVRVIYFFQNTRGEISLAFLVEKSERENLTKAAVNALAERAKLLKKQAPA